MDVVLAKALDKIEKSMEGYSVKDIREGREKEIEEVVNRILINEAKLDESEFKIVYGIDVNKRLAYYSLEFPELQLEKKYDLGTFM